ncbi:AraC family transcriptional regulator [Bacillus sp. NMCC46]|uniref:GyrI-like domain-containing protein n=1 Tax=Bacillus TaxID=1386 RepID=UPI000BA53A81|nr:MULTISPECIES: GyrI-like domain-containing protein [Bacillus]MCY7616960.1 GyrI-like domain-containing protein [Bacillus pumilus]PAC82833.1 AraC family transcriptional regulator [Bacillus sp. 7788]PRS44897.1 AraC family transcriptional regulator [Bacillus sp. NMCC46]
MYDIVTLEKQWMKGLSVRTTNEMELTKERKIAPLWQQFFAQQPHGGQAPVIGLYSDYEKDEHGSYLFTAGHFVDQHLEHVKEIPSSTYARFRTRKGPIEEVVLETWQQIWNWDQRYFRTYTGDFEWYDERSIDPKEAQIDIYIAVDEKIVAKTNSIS